MASKSNAGSGIQKTSDRRTPCSCEPRKTSPEDPSRRYGIRLALVDPRSALSDALQHTPGWKVGYEDTQSVVFVASG